ncbi:lysine--tRNA ligase [Enterococcus sp. CSURQ0835]|uniref:lysine--tRNA ligase n=1 Tax=Enterococcus sp. CSURQ0835 TaxID=2681394 RepID=UPI00135BD747|nr:lysine--tRNA ligase [Enterococcus sp. CSURQ0835]
MHWAYEAAKKILKRKPTGIQTCASGVSPSGFVHVGNFRELATTYFVVTALKDLGGDPRFILSWDDYDRLRKLPKNVTGVAETEIGKPYTKVPGPFGSSESYGTYFEQLFEKDLQKLGIAPEYLYQTKHYESGVYDEALKKVLRNRKEIYDILARFRTEKPDATEREHYFPISLYCETCQHDQTTITDFDEATLTLHYTCKFGHQGSQKIGYGQQVKLHWKIDWPMRWQYEGVVFEPGGKDHSSKNGSFDVATAVAKEIFDYPAPEYEPYDFVNIKGQTKKMSSSAGNIITLDELLDIYTPEVVFYLYGKYLPKAQFNLGLDEDVLRNYSEFERKVAAVKNKSADETLQQLIFLTGVDLTQTYPAFSHVVNILALTANDQRLTQNILEKEGYQEAAIAHLLKRAAYWIENDASSRLLTIRQQKDDALYQKLSPQIKAELAAFVALLENTTRDEPDLMQKIYDLTPAKDKKTKRKDQKELFQAIYQLTLGQDHGPRIPLLVKVVGKERIIQLLN